MNETTRRIMQQLNTKLVQGPQGLSGPQGPKGDKGADGTGVQSYATLSDLQIALPNGSNTPVWVIADKSWYYWSGEITADTTAPTVTASPASGTYVGTQTVTLSANETATIYYTTNGTTPDQNSTVYSSPISVPATGTIKYFGKDAAGNVSAVQTASYTITVPDSTPPEAVTNLAAGTPTASTVPLTWTASIASDISKYEVAYSTDGTNFTVANGNITGASYTVTGLPINTLHTFRVVAVDTSNNRSTAVITTATTAAVPLLSITDNFDRADASTLGTTTTGGKTWSSGLQIIGNQAGTATNLTTNGFTTFDSTKADNVEISADVTVPTSFTGATIAGIVFRLKSTIALYAFGLKSDVQIGLYATGITGGPALPANKTVASLAGGTHTLKVKLMGQLVECYLDGVLQYSFKDTNHYTSSVHGLGMYGATVPKFDNFSVNEVADTSAPIILNSPAEGAYPSARNVTLSTISIEPAEIFYTTDGSTPTISSSLYSTPIPISATTTLKYISRDSHGNIGSVQTSIYTITPVSAGTVVFADTFDRANATDLGTSSSGQAWTPAHATARLGITANQLSWVAGNPPVNVIHFVDSGYSSGIELSVDIPAATADQCGIVLRYADSNNYLKLFRLGTGAGHQMHLQRIVAGASAAIVQSTQSTISPPYKLRVILEGTRIKGYFDSTLVIDIDIPDFISNTKHGVIVNNGTDARLDNFEIKTV